MTLTFRVRKKTYKKTYSFIDFPPRICKLGTEAQKKSQESHEPATPLRYPYSIALCRSRTSHLAP